MSTTSENVFQCAGVGGHVAILSPPVPIPQGYVWMTKEEAITFAAWLVVAAGGKRQEGFDPPALDVLRSLVDQIQEEG